MAGELTVSGVTTSLYGALYFNGSYDRQGSLKNGKPAYYGPGSFVEIQWTGGAWHMAMSGPEDFINSNPSPFPPNTGWTSTTGGGDVPPTVSGAEVSIITDPPVFLSAATGTSGFTIDVTLTEDDTPPLLPSTGVTGFSVLVNGVSRSVTSAARKGASTPDYKKITLTLASKIEPGDTVTVAYSGGNVTDSAITPNALANFTSQSVTNNVPYKIVGPDSIIEAPGAERDFEAPEYVYAAIMEIPPKIVGGLLLERPYRPYPSVSSRPTHGQVWPRGSC